MRLRAVAAVLSLALLALCVPGGGAPAGAQTAGGGDSAAVADRHAAARGANPQMCDLAARGVDQPAAVDEKMR